MWRATSRSRGTTAFPRHSHHRSRHSRRASPHQQAADASQASSYPVQLGPKSTWRWRQMASTSEASHRPHVVTCASEQTAINWGSHDPSSGSITVSGSQNLGKNLDACQIIRKDMTDNTDEEVPGAGCGGRAPCPLRTPPSRTSTPSATWKDGALSFGFSWRFRCLGMVVKSLAINLTFCQPLPTA